MVSAAGGIILAILVLAIIGLIGWVVFTQMRARKLGLPPPSMKSYIPFMNSHNSSYGGGGGGIAGWFRSLGGNARTSGGGAYEQPLAGGSNARRGFGPLDPDEAWDARVGGEADMYGPYGDDNTHGGGGRQSTSYGGAARGADRYEMNVASPRDDGFDDVDVEAGGRGRQGPRVNPFEDEAEPSNMSMRGVSPRPIDTSVGGGNDGGKGNSPTERRSMFRENV